MSSSTQSATTVPVAMYYVVPIESDDDGKSRKSDDHVQSCNYYVYDKNQDNDKDKKNYVLIPDPPLLQAVSTGLGVDYVVLQQLSPLEMKKPPSNPAKDVTLFSATARNEKSTSGEKPLPNVFLAAAPRAEAMPVLAIPVGAPYRRGLILTFSAFNPSSGEFLLRSTSDPEIRGSTNASPVPPPPHEPR